MKRLFLSILLASICCAPALTVAQDAPAPEAAKAQGPDVANFAGTFTYAGGKKQIEKTEAEIERGLEEVNFVVRSVARGKLQDICKPHKKLNFKVQGKTLTTSSERHGPWSSPVDGSTFNGKNESGDPIKIQRKWRKNRIVETLRSERGVITRVFTLSKDGKSLTMSVSLKSSKFDETIKYAYSYRRK